MPNHRTFDIRPIKQFIKENIGSDYIDPFPYPFKEDAITYLKKNMNPSLINSEGALYPPSSVQRATYSQKKSNCIRRNLYR